MAPVPPLTTTLADASGVAALGGLLVVAHRHPRPRVEALAAVAAAALVLAAGLATFRDAWGRSGPSCRSSSSW